MKQEREGETEGRMSEDAIKDSGWRYMEWLTDGDAEKDKESVGE